MASLETTKEIIIHIKIKPLARKVSDYKGSVFIANMVHEGHVC